MIVRRTADEMTTDVSTSPLFGWSQSGAVDLSTSPVGSVTTRSTDPWPSITAVVPDFASNSLYKHQYTPVSSEVRFFKRKSKLGKFPFNCILSFMLSAMVIFSEVLCLKKISVSLWMPFFRFMFCRSDAEDLHWMVTDCPVFVHITELLSWLQSAWEIQRQRMGRNLRQNLKCTADMVASL